MRGSGQPQLLPLATETPRSAPHRPKPALLLPDMNAVVAVRRAVRAQAEALGVTDVDAVELVAGELAANCAQHRSGPAPGWLRCRRRGRWFVIEARNRCDA